MVSSESINFSKYSKINNETQSNEIEIIETKDNSDSNQKQEELSQTLIVSNQEQKEKSDINKTIHSINTLYGNPYNELRPKSLGKCIALFYDKENNPKITIGPDCK